MSKRQPTNALLVRATVAAMSEMPPATPLPPPTEFVVSFRHAFDLNRALDVQNVGALRLDWRSLRLANTDENHEATCKWRFRGIPFELETV